MKNANYFEALYHIGRALHQHAGNETELLQTTLNLTGQIAEIDQGCIVTFDESAKIESAYVLGMEINGKRETWYGLVDQSVIGFARHGQRTVVIRNLKSDPRWMHQASLPERGSAAAIPLIHGEHVYGVLLLIHLTDDYFTEPLVKMLEAAAEMAAQSVSMCRRMGSSAHERYRKIFEAAVVPIIVTDLGGEIVDANERACAMLGAERASLIDMSITAVDRLDSDSFDSKQMRGALPGDEIEYETVVRTTKGDVKALRLRARRVDVGDEKLLLWFAQESSEPGQLEQMRRDLAAMTYHDLRGPLHNIHGSLGRMGKILNGSQPPVVVDLLQIAERSAGQMGRMIDTLLDIDRLEEGRTILNRKPVSLNALLAEAVESVRPLLQENEQEFHLRIEDDLPMLKLDADMIMRVITNLIENAAKYTPDGGLIILSATTTDEGVCINVSDSGPGVPDHVKDQIFDKYVRIRRSDAPKGVGLGLAFCRLAVEAHGGRIWVDSGSDEGAVFCFVLPVIGQSKPAINPVEARQA